jgi:hypothetical protein
MTDNIENLVLEQLRGLCNQIEALQAETRTDFQEVKHRLTSIESGSQDLRDRLISPASEGEREVMSSFFEQQERLKDIEEKLLPFRDLAVLDSKVFDSFSKLAAIKLKEANEK